MCTQKSLLERISRGAQLASIRATIAPRKNMPRQNQAPCCSLAGTAIEEGARLLILAVFLCSFCSSFIRICHPRKYRISAMIERSSTVGGIGHPLASTQIFIEVPLPDFSSFRTYAGTSHVLCSCVSSKGFCDISHYPTSKLKTHKSRVAMIV